MTDYRRFWFRCALARRRALSAFGRAGRYPRGPVARAPDRQASADGEAPWPVRRATSLRPRPTRRHRPGGARRDRWAAAMLPAPLCAPEPDQVGQLAPVDRMEPAIFGRDRHDEFMSWPRAERKRELHLTSTYLKTFLVPQEKG